MNNNRSNIKVDAPQLLSVKQRIMRATKSALPPALKTSWWMIRLTVGISLLVTILQYLGVVAWLSEMLTPLFSLIGLPDEASLVFISGYLVNIYSAIAVVATLDLSGRAICILALMCLIAHNMILETAVQKKTGTPALRIIMVRTVYAIAGGFLLNWILPEQIVALQQTTVASVSESLSIQTVAINWATGTAWLIVRMFVLIVSLSVMQRLLSEFGVIAWLSKVLQPALKIFGLPPRTSFLWIVANVLGLAYGAAIMIEEAEKGHVDKVDADLLNHHVAISHSNLEDVILFASVGASLFWMLIPRLLLSIVAVWERRLEWYLFPERRPVVREIPVGTAKAG